MRKQNLRPPRTRSPGVRRDRLLAPQLARMSGSAGSVGTEPDRGTKVRRNVYQVLVSAPGFLLPFGGGVSSSFFSYRSRNVLQPLLRDSARSGRMPYGMAYLADA